MQYLASLPGAPGFGSTVSFKPALEILVVNGVDSDLLVTKNQFVVDTDAEALKQGIATLRNISGIQKIILLVPDYLKTEAEKTGAEVRAMDPLYPDTLPRMVMKNLFGKTVPVGKRCEDLGIGFVNAEAVVALHKAFSEGQIPIHKLVTVIKKDGSTVQARARIGTPVQDVLSALGTATQHGDRVVLGGPMTGRSLLYEEAPVEADTEAILAQDKSRIVPSSDSHCVNCGECVRVCPAKMPVNMLIRYLENGRFEEASQGYDLLSCIECGLCTYACIVKIPFSSTSCSGSRRSHGSRARRKPMLSQKFTGRIACALLAQRNQHPGEEHSHVARSSAGGAHGDLSIRGPGPPGHGSFHLLRHPLGVHPEPCHETPSHRGRRGCGGDRTALRDAASCHSTLVGGGVRHGGGRHRREMDLRRPWRQPLNPALVAIATLIISYKGIMI